MVITAMTYWARLERRDDEDDEESLVASDFVLRLLIPRGESICLRSSSLLPLFVHYPFTISYE